MLLLIGNLHWLLEIELFKNQNFIKNIYQVFDYIMLLLFITSKNVEHSSEKTPQVSSFSASRGLARFLPHRERPLLAWSGAHVEVYSFHTSAISAHFSSSGIFLFSHCIVSKVRLETNE